jgi:hypothetical protein
VRNEEECVCSVCLYCCNIFIGVRIIKEMPGLVASGGTPCITLIAFRVLFYVEKIQIWLNSVGIIDHFTWRLALIFILLKVLYC